MKKLYESPTHTSPSVGTIATESTEPWVENNFDQLKDCVDGYCNAGTLYESVANESYTLVDNKNKHLYNAYAGLLAEKLGVSVPALKKITTESLEGWDGVANNKEIALEGIIGTLWEKIKSFFKKIYNSIKEFFKRHFTRIGRTKKALENLEVVLGKTSKNLMKPDPGNYTGPLLKRYAGYGDVNASNVKQSLTNVGRLSSSIDAVNKSAEVMANTHMVDKDFFTKIKGLKDSSSAADKTKEDIDKSTPGIGSAIISSDKRKERSGKKEESKNLGEISKQAKGDAASMDAEVAITSSDDEGSEDANLEAAKKQMGGFMEEVAKALNTSINTKLISGKVIKQVVVNEKFELDVDLNSEADDATGVTLSAKTSLLPLVKTALEMLKAAESGIKKYGDINDTIMKNLDTIDGLIKDIDKIDPAKYGKYKKLINEQVRERLQMMQRFFSAYNKVGKNILDMTVDCCEGVVEYGVLSVKHFE